MRQYINLYTPFGEEIQKQLAEGDTSHILAEYPRPQMRRDSLLILNGYWDYAIVKGLDAPKPAQYDGKILVPFSPESLLSGVSRQLMPDETLFYSRTVTLSESFLRRFEPGEDYVADGDKCDNNVIIHFGAVDYACTLYVNGKMIGSHCGGYVPFSFDITDAVVAGDNLFELTVVDPSDTSYHSRGKQKMDAGGIWYTPQSGIWQTVWMEVLPCNYVRDMTILPDIDKGQCVIRFDVPVSSQGNVAVTLPDGKVTTTEIINNIAIVKVPEARLWSPEDPYLYEMKITVGRDEIDSYFAMRKIGVGIDEKGQKRITLNNKPYFHNGLLDQGYWSDGMLTPPSDEAMIYDIATMKECGFNMLRKHIKLEPLRWYYHCDRLGMLVWQDMVNGGRTYRFSTIGIYGFLNIVFKDNEKNYAKFSRQDAEGRQEYYNELVTTVNTLKNCPCIAVWVPFNEAWGQFDALKAVDMIRELDPTRLIDHASGWQDQKGGDFKSLHIYFKPIRFRTDSRVLVLSEFGGYSLPEEGHVFNLAKSFGYKKFDTKEQLQAALKTLYESKIVPSIAKGLSATVYTEVSDVEDEINGLLTYDRKVLKVDKDFMREINRKICLK